MSDTDGEKEKEKTFSQTFNKPFPVAVRHAAFCFPIPPTPPHTSSPLPLLAAPEVTLPGQRRPGARFHLRTNLWRADMQALVFYQNANNIICNIQGNIIVVLIGEKKNVDGCTCPPHHPIILITAAELEGGVGRDGLISTPMRFWCVSANRTRSARSER